MTLNLPNKTQPINQSKKFYKGLEILKKEDIIGERVRVRSRLESSQLIHGKNKRISESTSREYNNGVDVKQLIEH